LIYTRKDFDAYFFFTTFFTAFFAAFFVAICFSCLMLIMPFSKKAFSEIQFTTTTADLRKISETYQKRKWGAC